MVKAGRDDPSSSSSDLLSLPPELILEIIAYLPLAAHLIFRLQVCSALRTTSHDAHAPQKNSSSSSSDLSNATNNAGSRLRTVSLNLGPLKLTPPHCFSLSQWLAARQEFQRLRLARPDEDSEEVHGDLTETVVDESSGTQHLIAPDLEAHRDSLALQPAAFDWQQGAAASLRSTTSDPRPVAPSTRLANHTHKVGVQERRDAGPAHEARMLRRILGFLTLVSPTETLPPEWTLPPWEARMAEAARRSKLADLPRLAEGLAPWNGVPSEEEQRTSGRCETSQMALPSSRSRQSSAGALRTLSLIGWSGISGEEVVSLLRTCPGLGHVRVVLKTDRLDNGPWEHLRSARGAKHIAYRRQERVVRSPPPVPNEVPAAAEETAGDPPAQSAAPAASSSSSSPSPAYLETQVVVNVGSRVPPGAHLQIKGQGLSAGYRALCYSPSSVSQPGSYNEQARGVETGAGMAAAALHVIFQGRFRLPDALEIEEMLAWSEVRCSACRAVLLF
ncbi:hypothetical protein BCV69DRAFT_6946 [Microstroma glucosiphilum]|uniref:F-box domain-containing protein n=1 Tax=Pseudomicrostroma glucosiphilum TaxID=1684307 RepID=A0A316UEM3_9BASI|nr:hypothetical protein BCV69DRAFT_6946 [Pseudomicrostroma glucosiphilum]PWN23662.1 hypothetical protein BCV69DRAFT_6946 [Pseudomicrostroma glucosiphilum]